MASNTNPDVQIASSNLTLEELRQTLEGDDRKSIETNPTSGPDSNRSNSSDIAPAPPEEMIDEVVTKLRIPVVGRGDVDSLPTQPAVSIADRLDQVPIQRLPVSAIHSVPFIEPQPATVTAFESEPSPRPESHSTDTNPEEVVVRAVTEPVAPEETLKITSDLQERPEDWMPKPDFNERRTTKTAKPLEAPKQAFRELTDRVLDEFPLGPCTVLLIADADNYSAGDTVSYQLAWHLANRKVGKVLVVDSHFEDRKLTSKLNLCNEIGFADVSTSEPQWEQAICETEAHHLDFLPVGSRLNCKRHLSGELEIADTVRRMKEEYQFVIVSVGNVFHRGTAIWGRHCDATYLAIEMNSANQTLAKSGVVRLQQYGARLLGCVVTDAAA